MSMLSLLMLTCGVAFAEPAGVVTDLAGTLKSFNAINARTFAVAVVGSEATNQVLGMAKADPALADGLYVMRVSEGDPVEVVRGTVGSTGLGCVVLVSRPPSGWSVVPYGDCTVPEGLPAARPLPRPGAPTYSMLEPYRPPGVSTATGTTTTSAPPAAPGASPPAPGASPPASGASPPPVTAASPTTVASGPIPSLPPAYAPSQPETGPCSPTSLMLSAPDPTAALLLSTVVGFGTGHFYAGNRSSGAAFAVIDGAATVVTAITTLAGAPAGTALGSSALVASHLIQAGSAPFVVTQERKTLLARCR